MQRLNRDASNLARSLLSLGIIVLALILTLIITNTISNGYSSLNLFIILGLLGLPLAVVAILKWRWAIYIFFFLLVFEGVPRNLINSASILLVKDVVLGLIYIGYFREFRFTAVLHPRLRFFSYLVLTVIFYSLAELFNPALTSPLIGLIGIKTLLFYVPLIYIGFSLVQSGSNLIKFLVYLMILTNISCLLGIYQYIGGYDVIKIFQPLSVLSSLGNLGEYYKIPGSFASPGNFAGFLQISFGLSLGLLYCRTSRTVTIISIVTVVSSCITLILMGQRSAWLFMLGCFLLGTFAQSKSRSTKFFRLGVAAFLIIGFLVAIASTNNIIGDRFSQFSSGSGFQQYLVDAPSGNVNFQLSRLTQEGTIFGNGVGMAAPGSRYLSNTSEFIEAYTALLIFEMGIPGLLLVLSLLIVLVWLNWKALNVVSDVRYHNLIFFGLILIIYTIVGSITYSPLSIPPTVQFFWFLPGIFVGLQTQVEQENHEFVSDMLFEDFYPLTKLQGVKN